MIFLSKINVPIFQGKGAAFQDFNCTLYDLEGSFHDRCHPFIATFLFYDDLFQFLTELFKVFDFYRRLSPPQKLNMTILKIRRFFISFSDQATFYFRGALVSIFLSSLLSHDQDKIKLLLINPTPTPTPTPPQKIYTPHSFY